MQCIERFCEFFEARFLQLQSKKWQKLDSDYLYYLYRLNEWSSFHTAGNQQFEGNIRGVSDIGKLKVERISGEISEFDLKEIVFL